MHNRNMLKKQRNWVIGTQINSHDERMDEPMESFVESDYEVEDEQSASNEPPMKTAKLDFDFGFGFYDGQEVKDGDTDYRDSNELQNLDIEEDDGTTSRKRRWTDSIQPWYRHGGANFQNK